jgi:hypothetical protein
MRASRLLAGAVGLAMMTFAVFGAIADDGVNLPGVLIFLAAVLLGNDLVLMPLAIGVGYLAVRIVPGWARAWVQIGLFVSIVVVAIALPFVIGAGVLSDNPSKLPLNYGRGLSITLATVWTAVLASASVGRWANRTRHAADEPAARRPTPPDRHRRSRT